MEFDKSRCYSALNADELKPGDKVVVADDLATLKRCVKDNSPIDTIRMIGEEDYLYRFGVKDNCVSFALAYLVEMKENCTNCERLGKTCKSREDDKITCCFDYKPKTEQKAEMPELISLGNGQYAEREKHYRPFKDTDELIKTWIAKRMITFPDLCMPHIWVRSKFNKAHKGCLITNFFGIYVMMNNQQCFLSRLFDEYTFLDGSPCGVEE